MRVEDITPIDEKVDVWSFGVTVYELVTGAHLPVISPARCLGLPALRSCYQ